MIRAARDHAAEAAWWLRSEGPRGLLWQAAGALAGRLFHAGAYIVYEADPILAPRLEGPPGLVVKLPTARDLPALHGLLGPRTVAKFSRRLGRGDECLLGLLEGAPAYWGWLRRGRGGAARVSADEGYLFDAHTVRPHRGEGLHTVMTAHRLRRLAQLGCRRALIAVSITNAPAHRVLTGKLPFQRLGVAVSAMMLGRRLGIQV